MKPFYQFKKQENEVTELYIYGDITYLKYGEDDVTAYDFAKDLADIDTDLVVRINSDGGAVSQGLAMYSLLKSFKHKVTTICDGFACSAASVVYMAGDHRLVRNSGLLLIHNAWSQVAGNANDFRKAADDLDKITQPSIDIYAEVTGLPKEEIKQMMDEEKWITADEALALGFATEIIQEEAKQSLREHYLQKQVVENKQLLEKLNTAERALNTLKEKYESPLTGWDAFFNTKK